MSLLELFCDVDEFCQTYALQNKKYLIGTSRLKPGPKATLWPSEIMTIIIHFHQSHYRDFKTYYREHVLKHLHEEFPHLVSYNRFVELMPSVLLPLGLYLLRRRGKCSGISYMDSTRIEVCHPKRIPRHQVFAGLAKRGKSSIGYFFGFKLHLIINEQGELLAFQLTPANVDDRQPVPQMTQHLWGKLFGDKGYISQKLFNLLFAQDVQLITPLRKNMKHRLLPLLDKLLLRKRSIIETVNDQLKNISQIQHTRHRSVINFLVNLIAGLIAYTHQPKKPALNLSAAELALLPVAI